MAEINSFLANPIVGLLGYVLSLLASIIAILQFLARRKIADERDGLEVEVAKLNQIISNSNDNITQGKKSQYFKDNSGAVNIDNRD